MRNEKGWKLFYSVLSMVFSLLSCGLGFGLLGDELAFPTRFIIGFIFILTPMWVFQLVIYAWRKNK